MGLELHLELYCQERDFIVCFCVTYRSYILHRMDSSPFFDQNNLEYKLCNKVYYTCRVQIFSAKMMGRILWHQFKISCAKEALPLK